jgi:hypothetical protein
MRVGITVDKNKQFYDRPGVMAQVEEGERVATARGGGYVRTVARRSMKYRKAGVASPPGTPPHAHRKTKKNPRGPLLRDRLYFAFDPDFEVGVVGPEALKGSNTRAPELQEFGGQTVMKVLVKPAETRKKRVLTPAQKAAFIALAKAGQIQRRKGEYRFVRVTLPARPTMGPALEISQPKLDDFYAGVVRP